MDRSACGVRLLLPALIALSTPACAPVRGGGPAVTPGVSFHFAQGSGPDTVVYRRSITSAGKDSVTGTRTVVRRVIEAADGTRLLEVEQRFPGGGGEIVDTALAEVHTLRAVAHR